MVRATSGPRWSAKDRKAFVIVGRGFGPNSEVRTASSEDGGKDLKEGAALVGIQQSVRCGGGASK